MRDRRRADVRTAINTYRTRTNVPRSYDGELSLTSITWFLQSSRSALQPCLMKDLNAVTIDAKALVFTEITRGSAICVVGAFQGIIRDSEPVPSGNLDSTQK